MIEVFLVGNRWAWHMISAAGRVLWLHPETHETDRQAFAQAKAYRTAWFSDTRDHRPGACI